MGGSGTYGVLIHVVFIWRSLGSLLRGFMSTNETSCFCKEQGVAKIICFDIQIAHDIFGVFDWRNKCLLNEDEIGDPWGI